MHGTCEKESLYDCSNNENEDGEISRKGGRDESCVADSEFATVHKVLISHRKAVSMCSGANSELVCRDISPGRMCCFWLR